MLSSLILLTIYLMYCSSALIITSGDNNIVCGIDTDCKTEPIVCTDSTNSCIIDCNTTDSCVGARLYLAANINRITCSTEDSCQRIQIICGTPPPPLTIPIGTSLDDFNGEIQECTLQTMHKSISKGSFICFGDILQCNMHSTTSHINLKDSYFQCELFDGDCILKCESPQSCGYNTKQISMGPTFNYKCRANSCQCFGGCLDNIHYDTIPDLNTFTSSIATNVDIKNSNNDESEEDDNDLLDGNGLFIMVLTVVGVVVICCFILIVFYYKKKAKTYGEALKNITKMQKEIDVNGDTDKTEGHQTNSKSDNFHVQINEEEINISTEPGAHNTKTGEIMHETKNSEGQETMMKNDLNENVENGDV